ncbi:MAG TPA: PadR family transcriptional regulator [Methanocella sp.]|nr:PadR family transcriptional regulator [Methanocella sp.]
MSSIDLIILGLLLRNPCSAYDLEKLIRDNHLNFLVKISMPAIYKSTVRMAQQGYLEAVTAKDGKMPEKTIYTVNTAGHEYFRRLLQEHSESPIGYQFEPNTVVLCLDNVGKSEGLEVLSRLKEKLADDAKFLSKAVEGGVFTPPLGRLIFRQQQMINETLLMWVDEARAEYDHSYDDLLSKPLEEI